MKPDCLLEIITCLDNAGFNVISCTCDNDASNVKIAKDLGVTEQNPMFPHPKRPDVNVFWFFDAVHLFKLLRYYSNNYSINSH